MVVTHRLDADHIKTVINEALIVAHESGRDFLTYKDWLNARDARRRDQAPIRSGNLTDQLRPPTTRPAMRSPRTICTGPPHPSVDHPARSCPGLRPAATPRGADVAVRALDRDADHDEPRRARRREPVPRHAVDRTVERPALGDVGRGGLRRQPRDGADQGHHPDEARASRRSARSSSRRTSCSTSCTRRPSGCSARRSRPSTTWPRR